MHDPEWDFEKEDPETETMTKRAILFLAFVVGPIALVALVGFWLAGKALP